MDDTAFPKQGQHSVGVARQYCGVLGKQDSCQVAVSLSVANDLASLPIAYRLYLPETWAADPIRRARAGVPEEIRLGTKTAIALGQIQAAQAEGVPEGIVLGAPSTCSAMHAVTCVPSIGHADRHAAETPLISAHVRKACVRAARYWAAGR